MYYITITNRIPCTTQSYETQKFFIDQTAAEYYVTEIFNQVYHDPDTCFISGEGKAKWSPSGILITED